MSDQKGHFQNQPKQPELGDLYPDYSEEEITEAEDTLRRYVELVWRIYQRHHKRKDGKI